MKNGDKVPPKGLFSRSKEFVGLAAKLGKKELSHRVSSLISKSDQLKRIQLQVEQANLFVQSLGRLKGAAMKVGQMLSIEAADFFPPQVVEVLSKLQDKAEAVDFAVIRKVLEEELGAELFARFESIDESPLASASIGQVHRARFQGQDLALKIQYPGIAESIQNDLAMVEKLFKGFLTLGRREIKTEALFGELESLLLQEVNYIQELALLEEYRSMLKERADFVVPQVVPELCRKRVLAMTFEPGLKLQAWLQSSPSVELREHFGRLILDLYAIEFFEAGLVQTDPNFSNFLFKAGPEQRQLVLLDFGATRRYSIDFRRDYSKLLFYIREGSEDDLLSHAIKMNLIDERESAETMKAFIEMLKISTEPFNPARQPFNFADLDYSREVRTKTADFVGQVQYSPPPHMLIFLHRKLGGIFSMLKAMNVSLDLSPYWQRLVERGAALEGANGPA